MDDPVATKQTSSASWVQPGEVLVHVGPRKTGTTALQASLALGDQSMRSLGYFLVPRNLQRARATKGVIDPAKRSLWKSALAELELRGDTGRGLISDESLHRFTPEQARRLIDDLGGSDRVRILITNRPLAKALPSLWQQHVKRGWMRQPLTEWIEMLLGDPENEIWREQRLDQYLQKWSLAVPEEQIAVLPLGYGPSDLLSDFEQLVGLPTSTLQRVRRNESLSVQEAEMLRWRNSCLPEGRIATRNLKRPRGPETQHGAPIHLPMWARPQIDEIQDQVARNVIEGQSYIIGGSDRLLLKPKIPSDVELSEAELELAKMAGRYVGTLLSERIAK